jgi:hypothetical protein
MEKIRFSRLSTFVCAGVVLCGQIVSAQVCQDTLVGYYSYSALGNGQAGSLLAGTGNGSGTSVGTGTGNTTAAFSNTELGQLLSGATNTVPFSSAGTLYFDGAGNIRASMTAQGGLAMPVGTYVLNSDCTITVTLTDNFSTATNRTVTALQGIVLSGGSVIDLGVLQNVSPTGGSTSTNTSTSTGGSTSTTTSTSSAGTGNGVAGLYESNLLITLVRAYSSLCAASNLSGSYAIVASGTRIAAVGTSSTGTGTGNGSSSGTGNGTGTGTGTSTASGQTEAPFFLFGRIQFDGNGNIVSPANNTSALSYLQFSGSYTVNPDCTGTMTLGGVSTAAGSGSGSSTSTTGTTTTNSSSPITLNFVITQPTTAASISTANVGGTRPGFQFSSSNSSETFFGVGTPQ